MKKIIILVKLLCIALVVSGQPTIDWPDSSWNMRTMSQNVFITGGLVVDSSIITIQDLQADSANFDYVLIDDDLVVGDDMDVVGDLTTGTITSDATVIATSTITTGANGGTSGQVNYIASDNDLGNTAINTSDQLTINDFGGGLVLNPTGGQSYLLTQQGANLATQSQGTGQNGGFTYFTKDGDGSDIITLAMFGVGLPTDITNRERLIFQWMTPNYAIYTEADGTGTLRPLVLFTEGNTDQLKLLTTGDVSMSGNLTVTGTIGIYGTMGFADSSVTLTMTQDVYVPVTNPANTLYTDGIEVGNLVFTGDSIQIVTAGNYDVHWDLCYSGANTDEYHVEIRVEGVGQGGKGEAIRDMSTDNVGCSSGHTMLAIGANEWITLTIKNNNNNNNATVVSGNLNIEKK